MSIAYFKRGDPFVLDMWLYDATIGLTEDPDDITRGIELIPEDVTIECQVNSIQGKKLGSLSFEAYEDQVTNKGKFIFQNAEPTTKWPVGEAVFDVKVSLMGQVKHSMSFKFNIVETYTP